MDVGDGATRSRPARRGAPAPDFFIFGAERSGTTLLSALLSAHPDVHVVNDSGLFRALNDVGPRTVVADVERIAARIHPTARTLYQRQRCHLMAPDAPLPARTPFAVIDRLNRRYRCRVELGHPTLVPRQVMEPLHGIAPTTRFLVAALWYSLLQSEGVQADVVGEKTPSHLHLAHWLRHAYPEAKAIALVRHPITNVAAILRRAYARNLEHALAIYLSYHDPRYDAIYDNALLVRYEDLIARPHEQLARIFAFLEVDSSTVVDRPASGSRSHYVGDRIDPERDRRLLAAVDQASASHIRARCRRPLRRYYPSLQDVIAS